MGLLQQMSEELETLVARAAPSVVSVEHGRGQGSGLVLAPDGYVLTNRHVVRSAGGRLRVGLAGGEDLRAEVVGRDDKTDLAVLRVDARGLASLALAAGKHVRVGQLVVAIGNPLRFERSVSLGVVSALDRSLSGEGQALIEGLIQTDAAINPGNSGGPLVDMDGAVVGINTAAVPHAQGIGFAVPAHTASWVAGVLMRHGEVRRPYLGIAARGIELDGPVAREAGQTRAVRIFRVEPRTPAADAGLREGDVLLTADGNALASIDDLQRAMVLGEAREMSLDVLRDRQRHARVIRPVRRPAPNVN